MIDLWWRAQLRRYDNIHQRCRADSHGNPREVRDKDACNANNRMANNRGDRGLTTIGVIKSNHLPFDDNSIDAHEHTHSPNPPPYFTLQLIILNTSLINTICKSLSCRKI